MASMALGMPKMSDTEKRIHAQTHNHGHHKNTQCRWEHLIGEHTNPKGNFLI